MHMIWKRAHGDMYGKNMKRISTSAINMMMAYHWPGNIRELKNIIERVVILSDSQTINHIEDLANAKKPVPSPQTEAKQTPLSPSDSSQDGSFSIATDVLPWQEFHQVTGKSYLKFILGKTSGNVSEAARVLCLERAYLHRLMKKLGIQRGVVVTD